MDIETDMQMNKIWLIGLKIEEIERQFLAYNWREEKLILNQLSDFLASHQDKALVCYSTTNFDFRVIFNAAKRLSNHKLVEQLQNRALIDMGTLLRRHYTPYGGSYSLKKLRFLIGYRYNNEILSGEDVAIKYYRLVRRDGRISENFANEALMYNLDDIRILKDLVAKFEHNIEFTSNFTDLINIEDIKNILSEAIYSKNDSDKFVRISLYKNYSTEVMQQLMSLGLPLPEIKEGVHTTALYWKSSFAFDQAKKFIRKLEFEE